MTEQVNDTSIETVETGVEASVEAQQPVAIEDTSVEPVQESEEVEVEVSHDETTEEASVEPESTPIKMENVEYDGHNLSLEIPEDAVKLATEKGFNPEELITELYGSEDFKFSDETYGKLCDAYGKFFVDMSISNLKLGNEATLRNYSDEQSVAEKQAFDAISDVVGGEQGWTQLEEYAATLPQEDTDAFNSAMESGDPVLQRFAIKALKANMPKQEQPLNLIEGKGTVSAAPTAISAEEYQASMANGSYYEDPQKWDGLRRAGLKAGI